MPQQRCRTAHATPSAAPREHAPEPLRSQAKMERRNSRRLRRNPLYVSGARVSTQDQPIANATIVAEERRSRSRGSCRSRSELPVLVHEPLIRARFSSAPRAPFVHELGGEAVDPTSVDKRYRADSDAGGDEAEDRRTEPQRQQHGRETEAEEGRNVLLQQTIHRFRPPSASRDGQLARRSRSALR